MLKLICSLNNGIQLMKRVTFIIIINECYKKKGQLLIKLLLKVTSYLTKA